MDMLGIQLFIIGIHCTTAISINQDQVLITNFGFFSTVVVMISMLGIQVISVGWGTSDPASDR